MKRSWTLDDAEFYILWNTHTDDILPRPFSYTSKATTYEEFDAEQIAARDRLQRRVDAGLHDAMAAIVQPDLYVVVTGWDEKSPLRHESEIRIMATRRGPGGYLISQAPGESFWHGGGYRITECDPLRLADEAVAALPEMPAGKQGEVVLPADETDELDYAFGSSGVRDSFEDTVQVRAKNFLDLKAEHAGRIRVVQGRSKFGPRGRIEHQLRWRDVEDDGRYVITDEHPPVAMPVDARQLISMINGRIADVVRAIKDERA
ncbi:ESX secretion-associated protein EspG [Nocardia sp. NPDC004068]|uniref:ESX secretion-associated protein EspG n=1 Tax=Nocardia sp. NPDC004068 TaxID=3364303 RepID=UPI0036B6130C